MNEGNEILHKYANDMLGVEEHFLDVLNYQADDKRLRDYREADELVGRMRETLRRHVHLLERVIEQLGVSSSESSLKKAATKVSGMATGFYNLMRQEDSVMRNFRDNYTALNMAVVGYTMLHSAALAQHNGELAELALKHMKELVPLVIETSRVIPAIVIKELSVEGKAIDTMVIQQAIDNTQQAWRE